MIKGKVWHNFKLYQLLDALGCILMYCAICDMTFDISEGGQQHTPEDKTWTVFCPNRHGVCGYYVSEGNKPKI